MRPFALAFVAGLLWLQQCAQVPPAAPLAWGLALLLGVALIAPRRVLLRACVLLVAGTLCGYGYGAWRAAAALAQALPRSLEQHDVRMTGIVTGLPQLLPNGTRFTFRVERAPAASIPEEISLSWYGEPGAAMPTFRAGQRWSWTVRLRRPRGLTNPHGFDFEAFALERGVRATGYVRPRSGVALLDERVDGWPQTLHRWRGAIRERMREELDGEPLAGVLVALAIGDQDSIAAHDWDVFWRTGVGHLMSISGLHITMLGVLGYAIAFRLWVRVPRLPLWQPARKAAVIAGAAAALAYTLMTGYAVPAQRTLFMLATGALCVLAGRHGSPSRVLALAALVVLAIDPWAVLTPGFWLSFGAVASIFYALSLRTGRMPRWSAIAGEQLAVTVIMLPLMLVLFQSFSLVSPLANAFAIPLVSLVVVPLTLVGAFLDIGLALHVAHAIMAGVMALLERMAAWDIAAIETHAPAAWTFALAIGGAAWLLAPRGVPLRSFGALCMAPMFLVVPPRPPPGTAWIDVLDVGNGLAIVVRTARHALVYDAGPRWSEDSDSGNRIVAPFLRGEGVRDLDLLMISHADDDHSGGAASVIETRRPKTFMSSLPPDDALWPREGILRCEAGQRWRWDGVDFRVLHPARAIYGETAKRKENDRSCVLRIATASASALLMGDAEARSEVEMLARDAPALKADVLVIPHHGSKTSSTERLIDAVHPALGILSVGYLNRYRHPNEAVVERYRRRAVTLERTDQRGALHIVLPASGGMPPEASGQEAACRYWSERRGCAYGK